MGTLAKSHFEWAQKLHEQGLLISGDGLEHSGILIKGKKRQMVHTWSQKK